MRTNPHHLLRIPARVAVVAVLSSVSVFFIPAPAQAVGTTYWVDNTNSSCSDSGTATQTTPTCTIGAATKKAVNPGDTVQVVAGNYREQVNVAGSGTATDPITLTAYSRGVTLIGTTNLSSATWAVTSTNAWSTSYSPASTPRQVLLDGSRLTQATSATSTTSGSWYYDSTAKLLSIDIGGSNPSVGHTIEAGAQSYGVSISGRSYVVVNGFTAVNQNLAGFRTSSSPNVTFSGDTATGSASNGILLDTGSTGSVVDGASVSGSVSTGIRVNGTTGATVRRSTSHDNGLHGIGLSNSSGATITGNETYDNVSTGTSTTADGIDVDTASPNATVADNRSHDNQHSGFQDYAGSNNSLFARNVAWNNGFHGFDTLNSTGVSYLNNTSWNNGGDGIAVEGNSTGATIRNNIVVDNGAMAASYDLYVDGSSASGLNADYDIVYNHNTSSTMKVNGTTYRSITAYATASGQEQHGSALAPAMIAPGSGDFHLQGGSPALDSADSSVTGFVATDPDGNGVIDDPLVPDTGNGSPAYADRGAYEEQPDLSATDYAPHAALVVSPTTLAIPPNGTVTADASGSADVDTFPIATYTVDFGDGSPAVVSTTPVATHTYTSTGSFPVTLTVTDTAGKTDTATEHVDVSTRALATYYVSQASGCSDTGTGTQLTPFCTISAAVKVAVAGDTVLVAPGEYHEQVTPPNPGQAGSPLTIQATGPGAVVLGTNDLSDASGWTATGTNAWSHPFTAASTSTRVWLGNTELPAATSATTTPTDSFYYDSTAHLLYVDIGGSNPASGHTVSAAARSYGFLLRNQSHVVASGFTIRNTNLVGVEVDHGDHISLDHFDVADAGSHGISVDSTASASLSRITSASNLAIGVRFSGATDSTLSDSVTHDNGFHGVSVQGSTNVTITRVTSYANATPNTRVAAGIDISLGATNTVIQDSTSYNNQDSGFESYSGSTGTVFRRNLSYNNGDHGIDDNGTTGVTAISNTVVGNTTSGINFEGSSTGAFVRDNIAVNNALTSPRSVGQIRVDTSSVSGASLNRDLVYGGTLFDFSGTRYTDLPTMSAASGQETNGISADPAFANATGNDFHLTSISPAIDAAYTGSSQWQSIDLDGNAPIDDQGMPNTGSGPDAIADLGALEYEGPFAAGTLTPTGGRAPLTVQVDGTASSSPGQSVTSYKWACGNGFTITNATGSCTYLLNGNYTVTLTITDSAGRTAVWSGVVQVGRAVVTAKLAATPQSGVTPLTVTLDATGSSVSNGTTITSYAFNCGNGAKTVTQSGPTTTCVYNNAGTFTATVTARDTAGDSGQATVAVTATTPPKVTAKLVATPSTGFVPMDVTLSASGSTVSDGSTITSYAFDCGNGTTYGSQPAATVTCHYATAGTYTAKVTAANAAGLSGAASVTVNVKADVPPTAVLKISPNTPHAGQTVTLGGSGSTDPDNTPIATYQFDCGNGVKTAAQSGPTTTCTYSTGIYTVRMTVTDTGGLSSTTTKTITVS